jgi:hypothetical protein
MIRSFTRLRDVSPGFDHRQVLAFDVSLPFPEYDTREKAIAFHRLLQDRLAALPGVVSIGSTTTVPLEGFGTGCSVVWREGRPFPPGEQPPCVSTPIVARDFGNTSYSGAWTHADVGGCRRPIAGGGGHGGPGRSRGGEARSAGISSNGSQSTTSRGVVGVVSGTQAEALDRPPSEAVFYAVTGFRPNQRTGVVNFLTYLVRTQGVDPKVLIPSARRLLAEANPRIPFVNARTMDEVFSQSMSRTSFVMILLGVAAAVALALSAVGTYGVISYLVTQRRPEIGVRIALGASVRLVSRQIVFQSLRLAAIGVAIGLALAWATTRLLSRLLFDVSPTDPLVLGSVAVALLGRARVRASAPCRADRSGGSASRRGLNNRHRASRCRHQASSIRYQASSIRTRLAETCSITFLRRQTEE